MAKALILSYRVTLTGQANYYLPLRIIHYKGESTKTESLHYVRIFYQAMAIFLRKHYPHYSFVARFFIRAAIGLRATMAALRRFLFPRRRHVVDETAGEWCVYSREPAAVERRPLRSRGLTPALVTADRDAVASLLARASGVQQVVFRPRPCSLTKRLSPAWRRGALLVGCVFISTRPKAEKSFRPIRCFHNLCPSIKFSSGNRLLLRAVEPEDVALIYRWENDSSSWGDGCALSPYSRYAIRTYIEESLRQDIFQMRQLRFMASSPCFGRGGRGRGFEPFRHPTPTTAELRWVSMSMLPHVGRE